MNQGVGKSKVSNRELDHFLDDIACDRRAFLGLEMTQKWKIGSRSIPVETDCFERKGFKAKGLSAASYHGGAESW